MRARNALLAIASLAALLPLHAQSTNKEGPQLYRVEIDFRDGNDAGSMTDRRYSLLVTESRKAVFKVGSKSPAVSGSAQSQTGNTVVSTEITYLDVGVNIDCVVVAVGTSSKVALHGSLDLSTISGEAQVASGVRNPVIRQTKLDLDATLELNKPTVLATIDDPITARKLQVEATVTKAN
jgi:hypothetical protein